MAQEASQLTTSPPLPGLTLVQEMNKIARTIGTDFAGPTDPAGLAFPYCVWADTGNGLIKRRNAANTAWVVEGMLFAAPNYSSDADLAWLGTPVGVEFSLHPDAPPPPTGDARFRYILLTAGKTGTGQYNEGVLTSETVTGSDPTITATAVVSLAGSPFDGVTIDLINTSRVFLRPGEGPGPIVDSQNAAHSHTGTAESAGAHTHGAAKIGGSGASVGTASPVAVGTSTDLAGAHTHTLTINSEGGAEAHPRYIPRTYYMRIL